VAVAVMPGGRRFITSSDRLTTTTPGANAKDLVVDVGLGSKPEMSPR